MAEHRMHVMEWGQGGPVLLLHGNPTWGLLYRKVVHALLGEPLRLIVPDLVELAFSDKPRDPAAHKLEAHARWLGALLDACDPTGSWPFFRWLRRSRRRSVEWCRKFLDSLEREA